MFLPEETEKIHVNLQLAYLTSISCWLTAHSISISIVETPISFKYYYPLEQVVVR